MKRAPPAAEPRPATPSPRTAPPPPGAPFGIPPGPPLLLFDETVFCTFFPPPLSSPGWPPNPAMATEQAGQVLDNLADFKNNPITCQGIGGLRAAGEEGVRGGVRLHGLCPWSGEGPRRAGRAFRLARPAERGEEALPVGETKILPREASAPPKARPIHRGIRVYQKPAPFGGAGGAWGVSPAGRTGTGTKASRPKARAERVRTTGPRTRARPRSGERRQERRTAPPAR